MSFLLIYVIHCVFRSEDFDKEELVYDFVSKIGYQMVAS